MILQAQANATARAAAAAPRRNHGHLPSGDRHAPSRPPDFRTPPERAPQPGATGRPERGSAIGSYLVFQPEKGGKGPAHLAEDLARLQVVGGEPIPLLGAFSASMDEETRRRVEEAGYRVVPDLTERFLHPHPWEQDDPSAVRLEEPEKVTPRAPLKEPRFQSPLTRRYTGRGIGIAVVDTGIYPHPDFTSPGNRIVAFKDFVNGYALPYDDNGHGTQVAGAAAGNGFLSGGLYRGTAPDAHLVAVKVLGRNGSGRTSDILRGINWVVENKDRYNIRVLNLSLGNDTRPANPAGDPIQKAVENAVRAGIVVVVSAGNGGPRPGSISAPGDNPFVITVGAVDDRNTPDRSDDFIPDFSSRGVPGGSKPDLVAPGEAIMGPNAPGSRTEAAAQKYSAVNETLEWLQNLRPRDLVHVPEETLRLIGLNSRSIRRFKASPESAARELQRLLRATERLPIIENSYVGSPGTSLAAPIVAGVVAQMLEANPDLTPEQVRAILRETAVPLEGYGPEAQGAGAVDPHGAILRALQEADRPAYQTRLVDFARERGVAL